jgi:hypothetical protein
VTQSHIHVGQLGVNGSIVIFLCQTATNPDPTGLARPCPQQGSVTGTITAANVIAGADPSNSWRGTLPGDHRHSAWRGLRKRPHDSLAGWGDTRPGPNHRQIRVQTGCAIPTAIRRTRPRSRATCRAPRGRGRTRVSSTQRSRALLLGVGRAGRAHLAGHHHRHPVIQPRPRVPEYPHENQDRHEGSYDAAHRESLWQE